MVQPPEHWHRYDLPRIRTDDARCWDRDSPTKPLMRAVRVEISESELSENTVQVTLPQDEHVLEALPPGAAEKSLDHGIHQRCPYRCLDDPHARSFRHPIELGSVLVVSVTDDELRPLPERRGVAELGPMFV
jgi:hypothetical protein